MDFRDYMHSEKLEQGKISIQGTCTYASVSTINVSSGAAAIYAYGDKITITQASGGTKYGYIVEIADTLLTVTGFPIANETITNAYFSHSAMTGHPIWINYIPTLTGGNADLSDFDVAEIMIDGKICELNFLALNKTVTGTAGFIQIDTPLVPMRNNFFQAQVFDGSVWKNGLIKSFTNGSLQLFKDELTNWVGNETGVYISFRIRYRYV